MDSDIRNESSQRVEKTNQDYNTADQTPAESSSRARSKSDPLEAAVGSIGRWQIIICLSIALSKIPVAFYQLGIIFLAPPVSFNCAEPPSDEKVCPDNCTRYEYDTTIFKNTITMEWDLVCGREWMKNMTQTIFMFGVLLGNVIFGILSDRFGRRKPFILAIIVQIITSILTSYAWDWYSFTIIRFILALFIGGTMITSFVITMEVTGVEYRQLFSMIFQIPFNIGHAIMVGVAYLSLESWSQFQFWLSVPTLIYLAYFWIIPESPRWLLTVGKTSQAVKILTKAAKLNNLPTDQIANQIEEYQRESKTVQKANITDLFRTRNMCCKTLFMCFGWLSCGICFFGVSQYIGQLAGNIFLNVLISAVIQIPGTILVIFLNNWFGRKKTLIGALCLSGFPLVAIAFIPEDCKTWIIICSLIGILACSMSFPTIYLYAGEVFPTVIRNTGMGLCSVMARVGSMIAPFIAGLDTFHYWIPPLIFGGIPLISAMLTLYLPETHGKSLPNTIEEAEGFGEKVDPDERTSKVVNTK